MKLVAVFATLLAVSLAAPTDVAVVPEKAVVAEKLVEKVETVSPISDSTNKDKVVDEPEKVSDEKTDKGEEKTADDVENEDAVKDNVDVVEGAVPAEVVTSPKKDDPEVAAVAPAEKEEKDEKITTEEETAEKEKNLSEYSAICRASTGATLEQIEAISKEPADDAPRAVKCYVKCIGEQLGVVKDDVLQKDVALAVKSSTVTAEDIEAAADSCGSLHTDDPCDSSYLRYSCYFRTSGKKIRIF